MERIRKAGIVPSTLRELKPKHIVQECSGEPLPTLDFEQLQLPSTLAPLVSHSDCDTYEAHIAHLQKAYSSGRYTMSSVQIIMEETTEVDQRRKPSV